MFPVLGGVSAVPRNLGPLTHEAGADDCGWMLWAQAADCRTDEVGPGPCSSDNPLQISFGNLEEPVQEEKAAFLFFPFY